MAASNIFNVVETTIADIHAAFEAGTLTARQLVQIYLDRIEAYDKKGPAINAVVSLNPNALAEADLAVIASLLEATGSPVLPLCFHPVARALAELPALRAAVYRAPLSNLAGWHATLTWLESGGVGPSRQQLLDLLAARDAETLAQMSAPQ